MCVSTCVCIKDAWISKGSIVRDAFEVQTKLASDKCQVHAFYFSGMSMICDAATKISLILLNKSTTFINESLNIYF